MKTLDMKKGWRMSKAPLSLENDSVEQALSKTDELWDVCIPVDVRMPLMEAGIVRDPVLADYSFESEWVENYAWWFHREFDTAELDSEADIWELVLESIDSHANIYLNATHIGRHINCHRPFIRDIKQIAKPGRNTLSVRVTSGLESVSQKDLDAVHFATSSEVVNGRTDRGDRRRAFVRRPQYTVGWDWGPRVVTIGMSKEAYIRCPRKAVLLSHKLSAVLERDRAIVKILAEAELYDIVGTADASLMARLSLNGEIKAEMMLDDVLLRSGINYLESEIIVESPSLWWPNGMGEQTLYDVELSLICAGNTHRMEPFQYGLRTVCIDMSRQDAESRNFKLHVNGVEMFCKGGDWIPADSIYQRVTAEKYETLISEAREAGFNMLRIWGGGIYETDWFYDACDRHGILVWHDFMFACCNYPDHQEWFRREAEFEMEYQTRRLRSRTCIALFCGNNENHWGLSDTTFEWSAPITHERQYGLYAANYLASCITRANCPEIPYWNSSPYGGSKPNSDFVGNTHHWRQCTMNPEMAMRIEPKEYDKISGRFVSEYGYIGPCPEESIREYFDGAPIDRNCRVWELHNNTFEKNTVVAGIEKHYRDASSLSLDEYILYAGMVQSTMLGYSLESFRFKGYCGGGLFWMYNDTWGEVGWTIIDYYLRRKVSYYGVKRAFAPVKFILRAINNEAVAVAANDTGNEIRLPVRAGYLSFDGKLDRTERLELILPPHSRGKVRAIPLDGMNLKNGTVVLIPENGPAAPAWLRTDDIRNLDLPGGDPAVTSVCDDGADLIIELESPVFLHGVHFLDDFNAGDNYFDMLPGEQKTLRIFGAAGKNIALRAVR